MRHPLVALSIAVLLPAAAHAQDGIRSRITLGVRAGYAVATGSSHAEPGTGSVPFGDEFHEQWSLQAEGAYRLLDRFAAGAYASYGFDSVGRAVKATCENAGASCSASTVRLGLLGTTTLRDIRPGVTPWLGFGVGWEWSTYSQTGQLKETFAGPELSLQAGAEWRVGGNLSIGPYFQVSLGRFSSIHQTVAAPFPSGRVDFEARSHEWFGLGVRGTIHL